MAQRIVDKLKLNNYPHKTILNAPARDYFESLETTNLAFEVKERQEDVVLVFVYSKEELVQQISDLTSRLHFNKNGYLFVAYPKIGSPNYAASVHRDEIFPALGIDPAGDGYLAGTDFKFSRMVKLDEDFTIVGLKYVPTRVATTKTSQRVADYHEKVVELRQRLAEAPETLRLFEELTPGYQRNWARYVYSAKQAATQAKRFDEMQLILGLGFKSKDLYQRRNQTP